MKKLLPLIALLCAFQAFPQSTPCPQDIVFNGSWSGGSGANGAPNHLDENKGISIQGNVLITENVKCACMDISNGFTLSIGNNLELNIQNDLILNGDLRLIGRSQLVQTHGQISKVSGNGRIFQDQTNHIDDVFRYSFWSSPVISSVSNRSFNVDAVLYDGTFPTSESSTLQPINWQSWNGDLSSLDGAATSPITLSNYWIYSMLNATTRDDWSQRFETGSIAAGQGFTMKSPDIKQNYTFSGIPNDGTIIVPGQANKTTLLGNPYPSAIDTQVFLRDNPHINEVYFWDHDGNSTHYAYSVIFPGTYYAVRNRATGVSSTKLLRTSSNSETVTYDSPGRYIPVGLGFMVELQEDRDIVFNNQQRAFATKSDDNSFFIEDQASDYPVLKFGFEHTYNNIEFHQQAAISFIEGNTFEDEPGYDTNASFAFSDVYFKFPESSENLAIAGIQEVEEDLQFPLAVFVSETQTIRLMVDEEHNIFHDYVLIDTETNQEYDIKEGPISLDLLEGTYENRFYIRFGKRNIETNLDNDLIVYNDNKEVVIKPFNDTEVLSYVIYNVLGQKLMSGESPSFAFNEPLIRVPSTYLDTGVLFVNVETNKGLFKTKLILH